MNTEELRRLAEAATPCVGFEDYSVTRDGRVLSTGANWRGYGTRELTQTLNADGYPKVRLSTGPFFERKRINMAVHRLVATAFLPPRPSPQDEIRHLNGDKTDNRAENLAWGTRADNAADRDAHGRTAKGERNGFAKLTSAQVATIRDLYERRRANQYQLAAAYGVNQRTISRIVRGEQWT